MFNPMMRLNYNDARKNQLRSFKADHLVSETQTYYGHGQQTKLVWRNDELGIYIYQGDSLVFLEKINTKYP